jgi:hypothetical protein
VVSGAGGYGIFVNGGDGSLNFGDASVTGTGDAVSVTGRSGGTVTFGGPITGGGVSLTGNDSGAIAFTGKLTLSGAGFTATGGGTVTATGAGSTINAPDALAVAATTIGAAGLRFQSISSDLTNATYGIELEGTGTSGSLTVTGTGAPGSGGTISNGTAAAIQLTQTYAPSFTDMTVSTRQAFNGSYVDGLTLADSTTGALDFGVTPPNSGLFGTVSITNSTINGGGISDDNTTLNLTVTGNTFSGVGDLWLGAYGTEATCAAITGNSGAGVIHLGMSDTSTFELPGYTGGPDDTGAVASYLESRNSMPAAAMVSGSGGGFTGGSGC